MSHYEFGKDEDWRRLGWAAVIVVVILIAVAFALGAWLL